MSQLHHINIIQQQQQQQQQQHNQTEKIKQSGGRSETSVRCIGEKLKMK